MNKKVFCSCLGKLLRLALCLQSPANNSCPCEDVTLSRSTSRLQAQRTELTNSKRLLSLRLAHFSQLVAFFFFFPPVRSKLNLPPRYYNWTGRYGPNCINAVPIAAHMFAVPSGATCAAGVIERAGLWRRVLNLFTHLKIGPRLRPRRVSQVLKGAGGKGRGGVGGGLIVVRQVVELSCLPPCDVIRSPEPESRCHGARTIKAVPNVIASPRLN